MFKKKICQTFFFPASKLTEQNMAKLRAAIKKNVIKICNGPGIMFFC